MSKDQLEAGPVYETLGPEYEDGTVAVRTIATGRIFVGIAEFIRLANANALHGERMRACGDYIQ